MTNEEQQRALFDKAMASAIERGLIAPESPSPAPGNADEWREQRAAAWQGRLAEPASDATS